MLLLFIPVALLAGLAAWLRHPAPMDVRIWVEPCSFPRYDDHAGNLPLAAVVRVTNFSKSTAWFLGFPGAPVYEVQQLVDGSWESSISATTSFSEESPLLPKQWTPLRTMESITVLAGPISEKATEMRIGLPFTPERPTPTKGHWVYSPIVKIIKRGQDYFPETKPGTHQEEQMLSWTWPNIPQSTSGPAP
jgi:hypothetical protein